MGASLLSCGLGQGGRFLTATVGLWLRSGGMAPAVEGRGGSSGVLGSDGLGPKGGVRTLGSEALGTGDGGDCVGTLRGGGAAPWGGAGPGQRLRARWRRRCRRLRGWEASRPSESRRLAPASSDLTPRSTSSEHRCWPRRGLAAELGWGLQGSSSSSTAEAASSSWSSSSSFSSSGCSWDPASGSSTAAGTGSSPCSGLASKSQAGGAEAAPGASH